MREINGESEGREGERQRERERERERRVTERRARARVGGSATEQERRSSFPAWAEANKSLRSHVGAVVFLFQKNGESGKRTLKQTAH